MALMESLESVLGKAAPDFELMSVDGKNYFLSSFADSKGLVIAFICNHCPYVKAIETRFLALAKSYLPSDVQFVAICSNDSTNYPEDAPAELLNRWREKNFGFPYLLDETQDVARAFDAKCTPDIYLYDGERKLYYHGQIDDNWKDESAVTRHNLKEAIDGLLADKPRPKDQKPTVGCSIKWKK